MGIRGGVSSPRFVSIWRMPNAKKSYGQNPEQFYDLLRSIFNYIILLVACQSPNREFVELFGLPSVIRISPSLSAG